MSSRIIEAGRAFVRGSFDGTAIEKGLRRTQQKLRAFGEGVSAVGKTMGLAGASVAAPMLAATVAFARAGAELEDVAKRTGISATALSELKYAAEQSGAGLGEVESAVRTLQKRLPNLGPALDSLGLSLEQLLALSPERQFELLAERIAAVADPSQRAALAMQVFGRAGAALLPMMGEMNRLRQEARDLGFALTPEDAKAADAFDDALARAKSAVEAVVRAVGAGLAPTLTTLVDRLVGAAKGAVAFLTTHKEIVLVVGGVAAAVTGLGAALFTAGNVIQKIAATLPLLIATFKGLGAAVAFLIANPMVLAFAGVAAVVASLLVDVNKLSEAMGRLGAGSRRDAGKRYRDQIAEAGRGPQERFGARKKKIAAALEEETRLVQQALTRQRLRLEKTKAAADKEADSKWTQTAKLAARAGFSGAIQEAAANVAALEEDLKSLQSARDDVGRTRWASAKKDAPPGADPTAGLGDELAQERIRAGREGLDEELALLRQAHDERVRQLEAEGKLTGEARAQLDELLALREREATQAADTRSAEERKAEAERAADEAERAAEERKRHAEEVADAGRQLAEDFEDAKLSAMEEGQAKELARIEAQARRRRAQLERDGLDTPENLARLDRLTSLQRELATRAGGGVRRVERQADVGTYSGALAGRLFGDGRLEQQLLREGVVEQKRTNRLLAAMAEGGGGLQVA